MFNPLVDSFNELTDAQVDEAIRNLSRRYFQTQNPQVQMQISNLLEMYKEEMRARNAAAMKKLSDDNGEEGLDNLINVS